MLCSLCNKRESVCVGWSVEENWQKIPAPACDECCGHGDETGECWPIDEDTPRQRVRAGDDNYIWCKDEMGARTLTLRASHPIREQEVPCPVCGVKLEVFVFPAGLPEA